ncbi:MAG: hypothetical protein ACJ763_13810 [Bdellovibrionia bacterium]
MSTRLKTYSSFLLGALIASTLLSLASWVSPSAKTYASSTCPDEGQGEKPEDCPWAGLARDLESVASQNGSVIKALQKEQPVLYSQMKADSRRKDWLELWGYCINFDELARGIIVSPTLIDPLVEFFAPPAGKPFMVNNREILHAGVQHTYGYLFSNLKTSFGYKRARWVRDTLDRGFGLPIGTLSPLPKAGSLFSNATYFAGRIAFKNEPSILKTLTRSASRAVSPTLVTYDFDSLKSMRLEETVHTETGDVIIRTDFVPFPHKVEGDTNTHWLIYSIADNRAERKKQHLVPAQLITAFPVETSFVEAALAADGLGENKTIVTRYNAYVEGLTFKSSTGTRRKL